MNQRIYLVTGVTGSGRKEVLEELKSFAESKNKTISIYDIGIAIEENAKNNDIPFVESKILNLDKSVLGLLRTLAIRDIQKRMENDTSDVIFIGMHALFVWKDTLIPGVSYRDLMELNINGVINIIDDIKNIIKTNKDHPKYIGERMPSYTSIQRWMIEEELLSEIFASIKGVKMYVHARAQEIENLYNFFFDDRKKVYLSYPITQIRNDPELLEKISNVYRSQVQEKFYVFNPLDIQDKTDFVQKTVEDPEFYSEENEKMIDSRTVTRDYRFITQSDAVVVLYPTDKLSSGVAAEMSFAYNHQIPVYIYYKESISPFLEEKAKIYKSFKELSIALDSFAKNEN